MARFVEGSQLGLSTGTMVGSLENPLGLLPRLKLITSTVGTNFPLEVMIWNMATGDELVTGRSADKLHRVLSQFPTLSFHAPNGGSGFRYFDGSPQSDKILGIFEKISSIYDGKPQFVIHPDQVAFFPDPKDFGFNYVFENMDNRSSRFKQPEDFAFSKVSGIVLDLAHLVTQGYDDESTRLLLVSFFSTLGESRIAGFHTSAILDKKRGIHVPIVGSGQEAIMKTLMMTALTLNKPIVSESGFFGDNVEAQLAAEIEFMNSCLEG